METSLTTNQNSVSQIDPELINNLVIKGDLAGLSNAQKVQYYKIFCERLGLDPLTQPFKLLKLQGKEILYCDRSGAQQLNKIHGVSHEVRSRELIEAAGVYQVTARASLPEGRFTDSIGAVNIQGLKGDAYANAIMKAETKAKRRSTLDLLGLGILDETEAETIPGATVEPLSPEPEVSVDDLHKEFMTLLERLIELQGEGARAFDPDNWKKERNVKTYRAAIADIKNKIYVAESTVAV
jgi:hypothetical protein